VLLLSEAGIDNPSGEYVRIAGTVDKVYTHGT